MTPQDVLNEIQRSKKYFQNYFNTCKTVDRVFSGKSDYLTEYSDSEMDVFWASMEILKPAIYSRAPQVVVNPRYSDSGPTDVATADLMERSINTELELGNIQQVMIDVRDDLALVNRGVAWVSYEVEKGKKKVCVESLHRESFLHAPAHKWCDVTWVARSAQMNRKDMADRFRETSDTLYEQAFYDQAEYSDDEDRGKTVVWEFWDKTTERVYWVTEGCDEFLDESDPYINVSTFFPCPMPAYGTRERNTTIPVPDYVRYQGILDQIDQATSKIYALLEQIRMFGLIPGGGDIAMAIQAALTVDTPFHLIPVPSAAVGASNGSMVSWWPIETIAQTISGLIEVRRQLLEDFYQMSGISDIMRGATEAQETLGAQKMKSRYGAVRIRDKIDEIVRLSRDTSRIVGEILAENFTADELLKLSQMDIPTKAEVTKKIKEVEGAAKAELMKLKEQVSQVEPESPEQAAEIQKEFAGRQQAIVDRFGPELEKLRNTVVVEDVMKILKNDDFRRLLIDIETDSTIMVDDESEKASRIEFLNAFNSASQSIAPLIQMGPNGAELAGSIMKFALQPYKANRELNRVIDEFIKKAPNAAGQSTGQDEAQMALAQSQQQLAQAELGKAQAQMAKVQADTEKANQEIQLKAAEAQSRAKEAEAKFMLEVEQTKSNIAETQARIEKIYAEMALAQEKLGLESAKSNREDVKLASDIRSKNKSDTLAAVNTVSGIVG